MKGKLAALREGRIPEDEEFISILEEKYAGGDEPDASVIVREEENDGDDDMDDEDDQLEGENVDGEGTELETRVDNLMTNIMHQSKEHQSKSFSSLY
jgi:hypothetical protein